MMETGKGVCSRCEYKWIDVSIQPCRSCKECSKFGGTEDNFKEAQLIMKCQDCGKECFDDKYPEVVFKDECHCICENCSINYYEDTNGKIKLRERF